MGKTSLLNVLLYGTGDIAPNSQHGACTATVCYFKYHEPNDTDKFKATIRFKPKAVVDLEISRFFQDKAALEDQEEEEDSVTQAERKSIKSQLSQICSWSGLSAEQVIKLGSHDPSAITLACNRSAELFNLQEPNQSIEITFSHSTARSFSQELREYISSSGTKSKSKAYWPIVELAYIHSSSELLRKCPGLVLVDLPGETDDSEARSEVARRSYSKFDRLMIITPSDRACDNKTAADLIREDHLCDIEADGKMQGKYLAVMITKIDLLEWKSFVENEEEPSAISEEFPAMYQTFEDLECQLEKTERGLDDANGQTAKGQTAKGRKRAFLESEIETLNGKCKRQCIDFRSRDSKKTFHQLFDEARNKFRSEKVKSDIEVFAVSSQAQRMLSQQKPIAGFTNSEETGFDALERWIIESSFSKREEHADGVLHRCLVLFDAIEGWVREDEVICLTQLPKTDLPKIIDALEGLKGAWLEQVKTADRNFRQFFWRQDIFKAKGNKQRQVKLVSAFKTTVRGFTRSLEPLRPPLHWATFHACLRRYGAPFKANTKPPRIIDWLSRVCVDICPNCFPSIPPCLCLLRIAIGMRATGAGLLKTGRRHFQMVFLDTRMS